MLGSLKGWDSGGQDIGWPEAIAIKLAVMWLVSSGFMMAVSVSTVTTLPSFIPSGKATPITLIAMTAYSTFQCL